MNKKGSAKNDTQDVFSGKRAFLKWSATMLGSLALHAMGLLPSMKAFAGMGKNKITNPSELPRKKLIFIAIDGLHPKYLELDSEGFPGGSDGNWLMPGVRRFLKKSMWFPEAKAFLPAATDMNHLNALAGTSSAQNGIIGVWAQPSGWNDDGEPVIAHSNLSFAKDDKGRQVDTLFHAWKRKWPKSKTLLISGKEWVGEMFRQPESDSAVDFIVTGPDHPDYIHPPEKESFADPSTDPDRECDPESGRLGLFGGSGWRPGEVSTRFYTGQRSLLTLQMEHFSKHFPHDSWIVDSTLKLFQRENPDMAYVLLAQCDDAGHCIGNAWDVSEFTEAEVPYKPPAHCENKPGYQLVSKRNKLLYREACLDAVRDVDVQFGRLIEGLEEQEILDNAQVILLSDHSAVNHLYSDDFTSTDMMRLLDNAGLVKDDNIYAFSVSSYGVLYWRNNKKQIARARQILQAHKTMNPQTGKKECPWWVLDREDMKNGVDGICLPGELYHKYYIEVDREQTMIWPDLIILAKNGWQIPVYNGHIPNVGIKAPKWTPPFRVYNGGHGSVDTLPIVAAISDPGHRTGENKRKIRIADLGVTAASMFGLELQSTTVGVDLSEDLL